LEKKSQKGGVKVPNVNWTFYVVLFGLCRRFRLTKKLENQRIPIKPWHQEAQ
jgi:hypothetical protein